MTQRFTVLEPSEGYLEVKGSKFICWLGPYADYEPALEAARKEHAKASHIIPIFRWVDEDGITVHEGTSDDGEPSGTAGRPSLAVVQGANLVNVGLYIVRYFGGTKLGTGPLARAYSGAVRDAIEAASLTPWEPIRRLTVPIAYDQVQQMELALRQIPPIPVERVHAANGVEYVFEEVQSRVDVAEAFLVDARLIEPQLDQ